MQMQSQLQMPRGQGGRRCVQDFLLPQVDDRPLRLEPALLMSNLAASTAEQQQVC
jgi:hypothetical protein